MIKFVDESGSINYCLCTVFVSRDANFDVITSDLMFSEIFLMFDVCATNLILKTIFIL